MIIIKHWKDKQKTVNGFLVRSEEGINRVVGDKGEC